VHYELLIGVKMDKEKKQSYQDKDGGEEKFRKPAKRAPKRKVCIFCVEKTGAIDYKDISKLKRFVTEKGKMIPRRTTGNCAKHQRELAVAIKNARIMALLPFKAE